jgi:16S rRNA (cytidine1402-2'-O)-methyltransferase
VPPGILYLVPTPIGNPRDITQRAVDVLTTVGVIAAEDTRHARTLLQPLGASARVLSYYDHNEESRAVQLVDELRTGTDVALISDAGTPLVNDPGYRLVVAAVDAGIRVCALPGANAPLTALVGSGLPSSTFHYAGFLPRKAAARRAAVERLRDLTATLVLFEAPHRLAETLDDLRSVLGDRPAALARNLSKVDEEYLRGPLSALHARLAALDTVRGQHTVVVAGAPEEIRSDAEVLAERLAAAILHHGGDRRLARDVVQEVAGLPRNRAYDLVREVGARG